MKILLSGATGFVGSHILSILGNDTIILSRKHLTDYSGTQFYCDLESNDIDDNAFKDVDVVVHCAARAHIMNDATLDPLALYRAVNVTSTLSLAKAAVKMGVKRFIYISSIKVNGESTDNNDVFKFTDVPNPVDDYGISKWEAESGLIELGKSTGMEIVIIRPTLVYGPGVKANFASLMNLVSKGVPLPFGFITQNKRSLVSVTNLVDLIITCIDHPKAANQLFLVSDDHDLSTSEMVSEMAKALDKPKWQIPLPIWCYKLVGKLFNKLDVVGRLTGSLQVDISHTKETLDWKPPQTIEQGFKETAQAFLINKNK